MADQDVGRASPPSGSNSLYGQVDEALTNFFGPINKGLKNTFGEPDPHLGLKMALSSIKVGPRMMPSIARYAGVPRRQLAQTNRNDPFDFTTVPINRYGPRGVIGMADQMPNFPMSRIGAQPPNPPTGGQLIHQALQGRANPQGVLQQTRMDQSRSMPLDIQPPANQSFSPTGVSAQDQFRQALMRQLLGGGQ